jgi:hypothetical protein
VGPVLYDLCARGRVVGQLEILAFSALRRFGASVSTPDLSGDVANARP